MMIWRKTPRGLPDVRDTTSRGQTDVCSTFSGRVTWYCGEYSIFKDGLNGRKKCLTSRNSKLRDPASKPELLNRQRVSRVGDASVSRISNESNAAFANHPACKLLAMPLRVQTTKPTVFISHLLVAFYPHSVNRMSSWLLWSARTLDRTDAITLVILQESLFHFILLLACAELL